MRAHARLCMLFLCSQCRPHPLWSCRLRGPAPGHKFFIKNQLELAFVSGVSIPVENTIAKILIAVRISKCKMHGIDFVVRTKYVILFEEWLILSKMFTKSFSHFILITTHDLLLQFKLSRKQIFRISSFAIVVFIRHEINRVGVLHHSVATKG
jgi:hypothetical protein